MLAGLKSVPWPIAGALALGGALTVVGALLIINSGSSRARPAPRPAPEPSSEPSPAPERTAGQLARPAGHSPERSLATLVGQRFMVGLHGATPTKELLKAVREGKIGGIVLFPDGADPAAAGEAVAELQEAARRGDNPPLLVAVDQEGGPIKRFPQGPPRRSLAETTRNQAFIEGQATGSFLKELHANVDLAPVVDLGLAESVIAQQGRTISADPQQVGRIAAAFVDGLQQPHTIAVAKHFPGLGSATVNTDEGRSEVTADVGQSLLPFRAVIRAGVRGVMVSTAIYSSLDPRHPAAWSRRIVGGLLRRHLGFRYLAFTDSLDSAGVHASTGTPAAAAAAARAGVDLLMVTELDSFAPAFRAVLASAENGRLPASRLEASYRRIVTAKDWAR